MIGVNGLSKMMEDYIRALNRWLELPDIDPDRDKEHHTFTTELSSDCECEYCSGEPMRPLDWQYGLDHIFPDYKYCPMCGRRVRE